MTHRHKNKGHTLLAKQKTTKMEVPELKGLERRNQSGRRAEARRKSDSGTGAKSPGTSVSTAKKTAESGAGAVCLADEAGAWVARCYAELFDLFPVVISEFDPIHEGDQCRQVLAAMQQMVACLQRQDQRVNALKVLEQEHHATALQVQNGSRADILLELMVEFSSDSWCSALEEVRSRYRV